MKRWFLAVVGGCALGSLVMIQGCEGKHAKEDGAAGAPADDGGSSGASMPGTAGFADTGDGGGGATAIGGAGAGPEIGLSWPIDCIPNKTCTGLRYPDIDSDNVAHDCGAPNYQGHTGTDIPISWEQMDAGVAVRAAADGEVWFASDGRFDRCPSAGEPACDNPTTSVEPGQTVGTVVCSELGPYCPGEPPGGECYWCFAGGNVVVILHDGVPGVFATHYDHMKNGSILVAPGDKVVRGQVIGLVGSAGNSTAPHLHFEVWADTWGQSADPWAGECGPNFGPSLWANDPAWK